MNRILGPDGWVVAPRRGCMVAIAISAALTLAACSSASRAPEQTGSLRAPAPQLQHESTTRNWATVLNPFTSSPRRRKRTRGYYKVGKPYQIKGVWYTPREDPSYDKVGIASFYAHDFHDKLTANGETFDMHALTAAHKTLPLPSYVTVQNLENGRTIKVRVNDRGPFVAGRIIDLSKHAAKVLGFKNKGLARVRVRYVGPAPLDGSTETEVAYLKRQPWARRMGLTR